MIQGRTMARPRRRPDGLAVLVTGSRGSGKSGWTIQRTEHDSRLLVWDSMGQWSREGLVRPVPTIQALHALIRQDLAHPGPFRFGYVGPIRTLITEGKRRTTIEYFPPFCQLACVWIKAAPGTVVAEELADVTYPGKAPIGWGDLVRKSRQNGGNVYGLTQRPTESDSTLPGNADIIHTGRLSRPGDRKTMAEYLDVPVEQITALPSLHYIERDLRTHKLSTGVLTFSRRRK